MGIERYCHLRENTTFMKHPLQNMSFSYKKNCSQIQMNDKSFDFLQLKRLSVE